MTSPRPSQLIFLPIVTTLGAVKCCRSVNLGLRANARACAASIPPRSDSCDANGEIRTFSPQSFRQLLSEAGGGQGQSCHVELRKTQQGVWVSPASVHGGHVKTTTECFSHTLGNKAYGMVLNMSLQRFPRVCCIPSSVRAESPPPLPQTSFLYPYSPPGGVTKGYRKYSYIFYFPPSVRCFLQLMQSDASAADSEADAVWKACWKKFLLGGWATINQPVYVCAHAICMRRRAWSTTAADCCWIICRSRCWRGVWLMYNRFWRERIWLRREEEPTSKAPFTWRLKKSWGSSMRRPLWARFAMESFVRKVATNGHTGGLKAKIIWLWMLQYGLANTRALLPWREVPRARARARTDTWRELWMWPDLIFNKSGSGGCQSRWAQRGERKLESPSDPNDRTDPSAWPESKEARQDHMGRGAEAATLSVSQDSSQRFGGTLMVQSEEFIPFQAVHKEFFLNLFFDGFADHWVLDTHEVEKETVEQKPAQRWTSLMRFRPSVCELALYSHIRKPRKRKRLKPHSLVKSPCVCSQHRTLGTVSA